MTFENKFDQWIKLVINHDPQHYQDLDWDWSDELMKFYEDPDVAIAAAKEDFVMCRDAGDCEEFNEK